MSQPRRVVLDTNIVLDAWLFHDPAAEVLKVALADRQLQWIATSAMREELVRVLNYPQIVPRLAFHKVGSEQLLAQFDALVQILQTPAKAEVTCRDPDDQKFIDLAVAHQALLLSKDKAVICMKKRLLTLAVSAQEAINSEAITTGCHA